MLFDLATVILDDDGFIAQLFHQQRSGYFNRFCFQIKLSGHIRRYIQQQVSLIQIRINRLHRERLDNEIVFFRQNLGVEESALLNLRCFLDLG